MQKIKIICAIFIAAMLLSAFTGCSGANDNAVTENSGNDAAGISESADTPKPDNSGVETEKGSNEVNVYNWGEYIDTSVLDDFENQTGIKVNYSTFENNEEMYAKLKIGGTDYDVIIPSDYMVSRLIAEGMLEKLDFANIPNNSLIGDEFKNTEYDPSGEYSVGYMSGTVGVIYNSAMVDGSPDSWELMFDPAYSGQILQIDNPRDAFGIALKYLGYSLNTTDESEINSAYELLKTQKPILQAYVMDTIFDKMESGEAAIGAYYAGDFLTMHENNEDLRFVLPKEGANRFEDAMCIPKGAANKKNAELFINFMAGTDAALKNTDATGYLTVNTEAAQEYGDSLDDESYEVMFPNDAKLSRCEVFLNLPQKTLALYDKLWVELKS